MGRTSGPSNVVRMEQTEGVSRPRAEVERYTDTEKRKKCTVCCGAWTACWVFAGTSTIFLMSRMCYSGFQMYKLPQWMVPRSRVPKVSVGGRTAPSAAKSAAHRDFRMKKYDNSSSSPSTSAGASQQKQWPTTQVPPWKVHLRFYHFANNALMWPVVMFFVAFTHHTILSELMWSKSRKTVWDVNWQSSGLNVALWFGIVGSSTFFYRKILIPNRRWARLRFWDWERELRTSTTSPWLPNVNGSISHHLDWWTTLWIVNVYHVVWSMITMMLDRQRGANYGFFFRNGMNYSRHCSPRWREWTELEIARESNDGQKPMPMRWGTDLQSNKWNALGVGGDLDREVCAASLSTSTTERKKFFYRSAHDMSDQQQLETQLSKAIDHGDDAKIASMSDRILAANPTNFLALRCRAVMLLHAGKYAAAHDVLEKIHSSCGKELQDDPAAQRDIAFHTAYCAYRAGNYTRVVESMSSFQNSSAAPFPTEMKHLLAQAFYNLEKFDAAADIYAQMLSDEEYRDDVERNELITNLCAAYASINVKKCVATVREAEEVSHDLLFNTATAHIEANEFDDAASVLDKAEQLCIRNHSQDTGGISSSVDLLKNPNAGVKKTPERELFDELAQVLVQKAYLMYRNGKEDEAKELLAAILHLKPTSVSTAAVASINWAAILRNTDFFDTYKKLKHAQTREVDIRLTKKQRLFVRYNAAMLLLHTGKLAQVRALVDQMVQEDPESDLAPLALVAVLLKEKKISKAQDAVKAFVEKHNLSGRGSRLILAQIAQEQGDLQRVVDELTQSSAATSGAELAPAIIATSAEIYVRLGLIQNAVALLKQAAGSKDASDSNKKALVQFGATLFVNTGNYGAAAEVFDLVDKKISSSPELLALQVAALARVDPKRATQLASTLPSSSLPVAASYSVDQLESMVPSRAEIEAKGYKREGEGAEEALDAPAAAKKPRHRPMRRPPQKGLGDPNAKIDPERWVPVNHRTYIKDLPDKKKRELRRLRADEEYIKRRQAAEKRKKAAAAAALAEE